jgi:hypothetical protein
VRVGEEIIYQMQTPVYTSYDPYHYLCTRIYPEDGSFVSVKALFDDVTIEKSVDDGSDPGDSPADPGDVDSGGGGSKGTVNPEGDPEDDSQTTSSSFGGGGGCFIQSLF